MPDVTLLVPGTQATSLVDDRGRVVYNAVRVGLGLHRDELGGRPPEEWGALLATEHRPGRWEPARSSLEAGTVVRAGEVVGTPYDGLLSLAHPWPYDWRLDLRHNASLLLGHLRTHRPAGGRFNLVGHSQGGLVIVLASKLTADVDEFSRLVARVVLVGAPLAGTLRAAEALLWGSEGLGREHAAVARELARTWPSIHQMLPVWDAVRHPDGAPLSADRQLLFERGWRGVEGAPVAEDHLRRARETAQLLQGPFSRFGPGILTLTLMGKRQMTPRWITRDRRGLPRERSWARRRQGDGLVPYRETLEWGGAAFAASVVALTDRPEPHAFLCNDPEVVDLVQRFLRAEAPPAPRLVAAADVGGAAGPPLQAAPA